MEFTTPSPINNQELKNRGGLTIGLAIKSRVANQAKRTPLHPFTPHLNAASRIAGKSSPKTTANSVFQTTDDLQANPDL